MRVTCAVPSRRRRRRALDRAKGFYGAASKQIRTVYDAIDKADDKGMLIIATTIPGA